MHACLATHKSVPITYRCVHEEVNTGMCLSYNDFNRMDSYVHTLVANKINAQT